MKVHVRIGFCVPMEISKLADADRIKEVVAALTVDDIKKVATKNLPEKVSNLPCLLVRISPEVSQYLHDKFPRKTSLAIAAAIADKI